MSLGWNDVQRVKRVEAQAEALGMKFTSSSVGHSWVDIGSGPETICLRPKDDCLPHYHRDARLFTGTVEQIEEWLQGIVWARDYDEMLKISNDKKRSEKEQVERNKHLMKTIKTGKLVTGKVGSYSDDEEDDEVSIDYNMADDYASLMMHQWDKLGNKIQLTVWLIDSIITTMKNTKKIKMNIRRHQALFNSELPFKARVERDRTKYTRKRKHRKDVE